MHVFLVSKIELEISPFFTVIQFYSDIIVKRVGKSPQEISTRPTFRNILTNLKEQDKTKMKLSLDMVRKHAFLYPTCRTILVKYFVEVSKTAEAERRGTFS